MPEGPGVPNSFLLWVVTGIADRAKHDHVPGNWGQLCAWLTHHVLLLGPLPTRWHLLHTVGPVHCLVS